MSGDHDAGGTGEFSVVIPAGGAGTRLWPLSTPERPKFLIDLLGAGSSLIQDTVARLAPIAARTLVVTGAAHADAVASQLPALGSADIVAEPSPRDSMAAIGLAAALLEERHGPHVFGSFAADHVIRAPEVLLASVRAAAAIAEQGFVVTIGIEPRYAATGFGWIRRGDALPDAIGAYRAAAFTEKPDQATAEAFLADGAYYWNAGMFVSRTDVLLAHLAERLPALHDAVRAIATAWDGSGRADAVARHWDAIERIAIDHALAEPVAAAGGVAVVASDCDWIDVGDFSVVASLVAPDPDGVTRINRVAPVGEVAATGTMVVGGDKPIVVVGADDLTIVDTPDALLVLSRDAAQAVKDAAKAIE